MMNNKEIEMTSETAPVDNVKFSSVTSDVEKHLYSYEGGDKSLAELNTFCEFNGKENAHTFLYNNNCKATWSNLRDEKIESLKKRLINFSFTLETLFSMQKSDDGEDMIPEQMLEVATGQTRDNVRLERATQMCETLGYIKTTLAELNELSEIRDRQELSQEPVPFEKIEEMLSGWKNNTEKYDPFSSIRTPEGDIIREQIDLAVNERLEFFEERIVELQRYLENESNSQNARPVLPDYVLKMCTGQSRDEEIKVARDTLVKSLERLRSEKTRAAAKIRERIEQVVDLYLARTVVKEVITGTLDINAIPVGEIMTSDTIVAELIERYKKEYVDINEFLK